MEEEYYFICPYCWSQISILLDLSTHEQTYVEDCEVCCNPIEISYRVENADEYDDVYDDPDDDEYWEDLADFSEVVDFYARRLD